MAMCCQVSVWKLRELKDSWPSASARPSRMPEQSRLWEALVSISHWGIFFRPRSYPGNLLLLFLLEDPRWSSVSVRVIQYCTWEGRRCSPDAKWQIYQTCLPLVQLVNVNEQDWERGIQACVDGVKTSTSNDQKLQRNRSFFGVSKSIQLPVMTMNFDAWYVFGSCSKLTIYRW